MTAARSTLPFSKEESVRIVSLRLFQCPFVVLAVFAMTHCARAAEAPAEKTEAGRFVNALAGLLHHDTNSVSANTNAATVAGRLSDFLGAQASTPAETNAPAVTNLATKLQDWLAAHQAAQTNASSNTLAQRSWLTLTNFLVTHVSTNQQNSTLAGTNLMQRVRAWVASEMQNNSNSTNNLKPALNELADLFQANTNKATATASTTNSTTETLLRGIGGFLSREIGRGSSSTNSNERPPQ
jgi:hypothetical protein